MTPAKALIVGSVIAGAAWLSLSEPAKADSRWWRDGASASLDLPAAEKACSAPQGEANKGDRVGCAVTAVLAGRTALARDRFLVVTDEDARDCIRQTSTRANDGLPIVAVMAAYCETKEGSFSDARRLLEVPQWRTAGARATDTDRRLETFRIVVLAQAVNGEGDAEKAISLIRGDSQFDTSEVLQAELFEIYAEDERWKDLVAWWNGLSSSNFRDQSLRALCEAQIALAQGSPKVAEHVLEAVPIKAPQDGARSLSIARYRVAHRNGDAETDTRSKTARMSDTVIASREGILTQSTSELSLPFISARGVNFGIDKEKLNRPGYALPIGFFF